MAFFRHSPEVLQRFLSFRKFSSYSAFMDGPKLAVDVEEGEFSHYIFSEEDAFTFLAFEGMENSWNTVFVSSSGVFYSPLGKNDIDQEKRGRLLSLIQPFSAAGPCPQPVGYAREGSRSNCQSERRSLNSTMPTDCAI